MKLKNIFVISVCAGAVLSSCVSENFNPNDSKEGVGYMDLSVDVQLPPTSRADGDDDIEYSQYEEAQNFPVELYAENGALVESWSRASYVPASYVLPVGSYTVKAHTAGDAEPLMYYPYFGGEKSYTLEKDAHYEVKVLCKMLNSSIKVNYSNDFASVFSDWTITLVAGENTVITYTQSDGLNPTVIYWLFETGITEIKVNFKGVLADGNTVTDNTYILTKDWENEGYDDDIKYYTGGDAIVINFNPQESDEGKITGITINANVTFGEEEPLVVSVNVEDAEPEGPTPDDPSNPNNPNDPNDTSITLSLPQDMIISATTDKTLGDTRITARKGLKSVFVRISSTSSNMMESLEAMKDNSGIDFVNGTNIVDNVPVGNLLNSLSGASVPTEGDQEYIFHIGDFFPMLSLMGPGANTFYMTVTDLEGNVKSGQLTLTLE